MEKEKLENEFRAFLRKIKTPAIDRGFDQTVFDWFYKQLDEKDKEIDGCYYAYESFKLEIKSLEDKIKELQPVSPSEHKTAEQDKLATITKCLYDNGIDIGTLNDEFNDSMMRAMTEYATLCRNKAIEEAVEIIEVRIEEVKKAQEKELEGTIPYWAGDTLIAELTHLLGNFRNILV